MSSESESVHFYWLWLRLHSPEHDNKEGPLLRLTDNVSVNLVIAQTYRDVGDGAGIQNVGILYSIDMADCPRKFYSFKKCVEKHIYDLKLLINVVLLM